MCGLVGVAGVIDEPSRDVFHNLLWIDALRGEDGTGLCAVDADAPEEPFVLKVSGSPLNLYDRKAYGLAMAINKQKGKALLMGHNRYKTVGDGSWYNAHPFECEHIVGAHNGRIGEYSLNKMRKKVDGVFDTDSELFFNFLNDQGIEETIKHLDQAPGDKYALTWYDKRDGTIHFLRNKERPFYYVFNKKRTLLFWASEIAFLFTALNRKKIEFVGKDVTSLAEDVHLSWKIPLKANESFGKVVRVVRKPVGFFPAKPKGTTTPSSFPRGGQSNSTSTAATAVAASGGVRDNVVRLTPGTALRADEYASNGSLVKPGAQGVGNGNRFVHMSYLVTPRDPIHAQYYLGYDSSTHLNQEAFEEAMCVGCANCGSMPAWGEPVKFLRQSGFICSPCITENRNDVLAVLNDAM